MQEVRKITASYRPHDNTKLVRIPPLLSVNVGADELYYVSVPLPRHLAKNLDLGPHARWYLRSVGPFESQGDPAKLDLID